MAFVTLDNVYKRYHMGEITINAADGMTFDIQKGEFAIIVGPSGSGKTTVLNMLGGMDTCDEGVISVDGERIDRFNRRQLTNYRRYDVGPDAEPYRKGKRRACGADNQGLHPCG